MLKEQSFKTKGMTRDLSESAFSKEFAFDNRNMRIILTDDNTMLSMVNEIGPKHVSIMQANEGYPSENFLVEDTVTSLYNLKGKVIGTARLNDYLVVFTHAEGEEKPDYIHRLIWNKDDEVFEDCLLYNGDLGFSMDYPIETLPYYENEDVQKVYWVDGKNYPRLINIVAQQTKIEGYTDNSFDFNVPFNPTAEVNVTRTTGSNGMFPAGVIQYVFTYVNRNMQESGIFYYSPLLYISPEGRGGRPDEIINNTFNITISKADSKFDYVRVYSIIRTSLNAIPQVKRVTDINLKDASLHSDIYEDKYDSSYIAVSDYSATRITPYKVVLHLSDTQGIEHKEVLNSIDDFSRYMESNTNLYLKDNTLENGELKYKMTPETEILNTHTIYYGMAEVQSLSERATDTNYYSWYFRHYSNTQGGIKTRVYQGNKWIEVFEYFHDNFKSLYGIESDRPTSEEIMANDYYVGAVLDEGIIRYVFKQSPDFNLFGYTANDFLFVCEFEASSGGYDFTKPIVRALLLSNIDQIVRNKMSPNGTVDESTNYLEIKHPSPYGVYVLTPQTGGYDLGVWNNQYVEYPVGGNAGWLNNFILNSDTDYTKSYIRQEVDEGQGDIITKYSVNCLAEGNYFLDSVEVQYSKTLKKWYFLDNLQSFGGHGNTAHTEGRNYEYRETPVKAYIDKRPEDPGTHQYFIISEKQNGEEETEHIYNCAIYQLKQPTGASVHYHLYDGVNISFIDTNTTGDTVDPTALLYLNRDKFIPLTMTHKDGKLFLGNIKMDRLLIKNILSNTFIESLKSCNITYQYAGVGDIKYEEENSGSQIYPYTNSLSNDSYKITSFKRGNTYRFGVQVQSTQGDWSDVIFLKDVPNNNIEGNVNNLRTLRSYAQTILDTSKVNTFIENGYTHIRPVIVYPDANERECLFQGIVCPTVFNLHDRKENAPFAQMSWFARPQSNATIQDDFSAQNGINDWNVNVNKWLPDPSENTGYYGHNNFNGVDFAEYRHFAMLNEAGRSNAEIQSNWGLHPYVKTRENGIDVIKGYNSLAALTSFPWGGKTQSFESYWVDRSICTMHSPEIYWGDDFTIPNIDSVKFRIVGYCEITSSVNKTTIDIDGSTKQLLHVSADSSDVYKSNFGRGLVNSVISTTGSDSWKVGLASVRWRDYSVKGYGWHKSSQTVTQNVTIPTGDLSFEHSSMSNIENWGFIIYPWQKTGSLNGFKVADTNNPDNDNQVSVLKTKRMSYLSTAQYSKYYWNYNHWTAPLSDCAIYNGINDSDGTSANSSGALRLKPNDPRLNDLIYYSNIDRLIPFGSDKYEVGIADAVADDKKSIKGTIIDDYPVFALAIKNTSTTVENVTTTRQEELSNYVSPVPAIYNTNDVSEFERTADPVSIKYKSLPHAVFAFANRNPEGESIANQMVPLPANSIVNWESQVGNGNGLWWMPSSTDKSTLLNQTTDANLFPNTDYGYLWIGEIYRDNINNQFGGNSEEALAANKWYIAGPDVKLEADRAATINWLQGDTYFQRFDALRVQPYTTKDENQIIDIVSYPCESYINMDGRYDTNRGLIDNTAINNTNFNKLNPVYSQKNNFFVQHYIPSYEVTDDFPTQIWHSLLKSNGEEVDTWSKITAASILDVDGSKGEITALDRYQDNIYCFQSRGVSQVLYNENTQIASTTGVPIEIANSGNVQGVRYLADNLGCNNKWAKCQTPNGIYFIDGINKDMWIISGQGVVNISRNNGFTSYFGSKDLSGVWKPQSEYPVLYYDYNNKDVLYIDKDECMAFSEYLNKYTSFYSYEGTPYFNNLRELGVISRIESTDSTSLWLHNKGKYNMFFGSYKPYSTTVICNEDIQKDKIFTNVEFRADVLNVDADGHKLEQTSNSDKTPIIPFDALEVWNEYQHGEQTLATTPIISTLKQKFRVWRAEVPRDDTNIMDRIRNTWAYFKLSKVTENTQKMTLHDLKVLFHE